MERNAQQSNHTPLTPHRRKFAAVIPINSPLVNSKTRSSGKKRRASKSVQCFNLEEGFDEPSTSTYTVTFEAGPLGLDFEPAFDEKSCCIKSIFDHPHHKNLLDRVKVGDVVVNINGSSIVSYEQAVALLQDITLRKKVILQRRLLPSIGGQKRNYQQNALEKSNDDERTIITTLSNPLMNSRVNESAVQNPIESIQGTLLNLERDLLKADKIVGDEYCKRERKNFSTHPVEAMLTARTATVPQTLSPVNSVSRSRLKSGKTSGNFFLGTVISCGNDLNLQQVGSNQVSPLGVKNFLCINKQHHSQVMERTPVNEFTALCSPKVAPKFPFNDIETSQTVNNSLNEQSSEEVSFSAEDQKARINTSTEERMKNGFIVENQRKINYTEGHELAIDTDSRVQSLMRNRQLDRVCTNYCSNTRSRADAISNEWQDESLQSLERQLCLLESNDNITSLTTNKKVDDVCGKQKKEEVKSTDEVQEQTNQGKKYQLDLVVEADLNRIDAQSISLNTNENHRDYNVSNDALIGETTRFNHINDEVFLSKQFYCADERNSNHLKNDIRCNNSVGKNLQNLMEYAAESRSLIPNLFQRDRRSQKQEKVKLAMLDKYSIKEDKSPAFCSDKDLSQTEKGDMVFSAQRARKSSELLENVLAGLSETLRIEISNGWNAAGSFAPNATREICSLEEQNILKCWTQQTKSKIDQGLVTKEATNAALIDFHHSYSDVTEQKAKTTQTSVNISNSKCTKDWSAFAGKQHFSHSNTLFCGKPYEKNREGTNASRLSKVDYKINLQILENTEESKEIQSKGTKKASLSSLCTPGLLVLNEMKISSVNNAAFKDQSSVLLMSSFNPIETEEKRTSSERLVVDCVSVIQPKDDLSSCQSWSTRDFCCTSKANSETNNDTHQQAQNEQLNVVDPRGTRVDHVVANSTAYEPLEAYKILQTDLETDLPIVEMMPMINDVDVNCLSTIELFKAQNHIVELQNQIRKKKLYALITKQEIGSLLKTNNSLSNRIRMLQDTLDEKEKEMLSKSSELLTCQGLLDDTQSSLHDKTDELAELQRLLEASKKQNSILTNKISEFVTERAKEKKAIEMELMQVQDEVNVINERRVEAEKLLRSMRCNLSDSQTKMTNTRNLLHHEREINLNLKISNEATMKELNGRIKEKESEAHRYKTIIADERIAHKKVLCLMKEQSNALDYQMLRSKSSFEAALKAVSRERDILLSELSRSNQSVHDISDLLYTTRNECAAKEDEFEKLKNNFASKFKLQEQDLNSKNEDLSKLNELLEKVEQNIRLLEERLQQSRRDVDHLTMLLDKTKVESAEKLEQFRETQSIELQRLSSEKEHLEKEVHRACDLWRQTKSQLVLAERKLIQVSNDSSKLRAENKNLNMSLQRSEDSLCEVRSQLETLEAEMQSNLDESFDSDFKGLSKADLVLKCIALRKDCFFDKSTTPDSASRRLETERKKNLSQLEEELALMSKEIENLVSALKSLEERMVLERQSKETAERATESLRVKLEAKVEELNKLAPKLAIEDDKNRNLMEAMENIKSQMLAKENDFAARESAWKAEHAVLESSFAEIVINKEEMEKALHIQMTEDSLTRKEAHDTQNYVIELKTQLADAEIKLAETTKRAESTVADASSKTCEFVLRQSFLEAECAKLHAKIKELELEVNLKNADLEEKAAEERRLNADLSKKCDELMLRDEQFENSATALSKMNIAMSSQKELICVLENRAKEAEHKSTLFDVTTKRLELFQSQLNEAVDASHDATLNHFRVTESKCDQLEQEVSALTDENNVLRDELRQARRLAAQLEISNKKFETRLCQVKGAYDAIKDQFRHTQNALEESIRISAGLKEDVEYKRIEVDRLLARVQILSATNLRLNSSMIFCSEQETCNKEYLAPSNGNVSRLEQAPITESYSEIHASQMQKLPDIINEKVHLFIKDIMDFVIEILNEVSNNIVSIKILLQPVRKQCSIEALDLATHNFQRRDNHHLYNDTQTLSAGLLHTLRALDGKLQNASALKEQIFCETPIINLPPVTLNDKTRDDTTSIINTLDQVKRVLHEEATSPAEVLESSTSKLNTIHSEKAAEFSKNQIENLSRDLKLANETLSAKDKVFADLEKIVIHHECERDILEKKLEFLTSSLRNLEEQLRQELALRSAAEEELARIRQECAVEEAKIQQEKVLASDHKKKTRETAKAAIRLIVNHVERRSNTLRGAAFCFWACNASTSYAVEHQARISSELSRQLCTTREKFALLKHHLKKNRKSGGAATIRGDFGLDRILEGYEQTEASNDIMADTLNKNI